MKISELVNHWNKTAANPMSIQSHAVHLPLEDAAKIEALAEMYPGRSKEQIITDLLRSALYELEAGMAYRPGHRVVAEDEMGDPIYEDVGETPRFSQLKKKHLQRLKAGGADTA